MIPSDFKIIAVSGGVDSMSLLHMLVKKADFQYVVAHFNHGIRPDSEKDERLVRSTAEQYNLPLEVDYGNLGPSANEATARAVRYAFLRTIQKKYGAQSIITAHHRDDVIETALINIIRGTHRKGISSLQSTGGIERPLLHLTKKQLIEYAKEHHVLWHEDVTNIDDSYLRNKIRNHLSVSNAHTKESILRIIDNVAKINNKIDKEIATISQLLLASQHSRRDFTVLPHAVAIEVMAYLLKQHSVKDVDRKKLSRAVNFIKTADAGSIMNLDKHTSLVVERERFRLHTNRRSLL